MRTLQKILVGHDLRAGGEAALRSAVVLAQQSRAQLKLVHVLEPYPVYQQLSHPLTTPYSTAELAERAGQYLQHRANELEHQVERVEYEVRSGKPFVELIVARRAWQADLLVIGGSAEEQSNFLGGTSERVLRKAMVPVLVAKRPLTVTTKVVLVPIDFSPGAKRAAVEAVAVAQRLGARIIFMHVIDVRAAYTVIADPLLVPQLRMTLLTPADLEPTWQTFLADLSLPPSLSWETRAVQGIPVPMILDHAAKLHADLIVMGTHGRTGIVHMLLGSVAERIVREATCTILTLRPDALQFELP